MRRCCWARRSQDRVEHSPLRWAVIGLGIVLVFLVLGNIGRFIARGMTSVGCACTLSAHRSSRPPCGMSG